MIYTWFYLQRDGPREEEEGQKGGGAVPDGEGHHPAAAGAVQRHPRHKSGKNKYILIISQVKMTTPSS